MPNFFIGMEGPDAPSPDQRKQPRIAFSGKGSVVSGRGRSRSQSATSASPVFSFIRRSGLISGNCSPFGSSERKKENRLKRRRPEESWRRIGATAAIPTDCSFSLS